LYRSAFPLCPISGAILNFTGDGGKTAAELNEAIAFLGADLRPVTGGLQQLWTIVAGKSWHVISRARMQ
jgi:hypothetical protein